MTDDIKSNAAARDNFALSSFGYFIAGIIALVTLSLITRTQDTAQVKITVLHMGGTALAGLWLYFLWEKKYWSFSKLALLAPFLAYLGYCIVSFLLNPYKLTAVDEIIRCLNYTLISCVIICFFRVRDVHLVKQTILYASAVSIFYGIVQIADRLLSKTGIEFPLDIFLWRNAFGGRVFSTAGNPNFYAAFLIIIFFIVLAHFLQTQKMRWLILSAGALLCLFFTESKGALLGFCAGAVFFGAVYGALFLKERYVRHKRLLNFSFFAVIFLSLFFVFLFAGKRQSAAFRVFTWLSSWEMIEQKPIFGYGFGSFRTIYPAFKRPEVFLIEKKHSIETQHPENEFLEQWCNGGIIGLGLFLWLIIFVFRAGIGGIKDKLSKFSKPPPTAYELLGFCSALFALLCHSFVDVSMRFVSSGIFFGVLTGLIVNIADSGAGIRDTDGYNEKPARWIIFLKASAVAAVALFCFVVAKEFFAMPDFAVRRYIFSEKLLDVAGGASLILTLAGGGYIFIRAVIFAQRPLSIIALTVFLLPAYFLFGSFSAGVYENMALIYAKNGNWFVGTQYYHKSAQIWPFNLVPTYAMSNIFGTKLDMSKTQITELGETEPVNDFERSEKYRTYILRHSPNYVKTHIFRAETYLQVSNFLVVAGDYKTADLYRDKSFEWADLYQKRDPVLPDIYYLKGAILTARKKYDDAEKEYYRNLHNPVYGRIAAGTAVAQDYILLARAEVLTGKTKEARAHFAKALEINPSDETALKELRKLR